MSESEFGALKQDFLHVRCELEKVKAVKQQLELTIAQRDARMAEITSELRAAQAAEHDATQETRSVISRFSADAAGYHTTIERLTSSLVQTQQERDCLVLRTKEATEYNSAVLGRERDLEQKLNEAEKKGELVAASNDDYRLELRQMNESIAILTRQNAELAEQLQSERSVNIETEAMAEAIRQHSETLQLDREDFQKAHDYASRLASQLAVAESSLKQEQEYNTTLKMQLAEEIERGRSADKSRDELIAEVDNKSIEVSKLAESLVKQQAEIDTMKQEYESKLKSFSESGQDAQRWVKSLMDSAREFAKLFQYSCLALDRFTEKSPLACQQLANFFQDMYIKIADDLAQINTEAAKDARDVHTIKSEMSARENELKAAIEAQTRYKRDAAQMRSRLGVATQKLEESSRELIKCKSAADSAKIQSDDALKRSEIEAASLRKKYQQQAKKLTSLNDFVDRVRVALAKVCAEFSQARLFPTSAPTRSSGRNTMADTRVQVEDCLQYLRATVESASRVHKDLQKRCASLESHLATSHTNHSQAVETLIGAREKAERDFESERENFKIRCTEAESGGIEIFDLSSKLADTEKKLAMMQSKLQIQQRSSDELVHDMETVITKLSDVLNAKMHYLKSYSWNTRSNYNEIKHFEILTQRLDAKANMEQGTRMNSSRKFNAKNRFKTVVTVIIGAIRFSNFSNGQVALREALDCASLRNIQALQAVRMNLHQANFPRLPLPRSKFGCVLPAKWLQLLALLDSKHTSKDRQEGSVTGDGNSTSSIKHDQQNLEGEIANLRLSLSKINEMNSHLQATADDLANQLEQRNETVALLRTQLVDDQRMIESETVRQLQIDVSSLQYEASRASELEVVAANQRTELHQLILQLEIMSNTVKSLREQMESVRYERDDARAKLAGVELEFVRLESALSQTPPRCDYRAYLGDRQPREIDITEQLKN